MTNKFIEKLNEVNPSIWISILSLMGCLTFLGIAFMAMHACTTGSEPILASVAQSGNLWTTTMPNYYTIQNHHIRTTFRNGQFHFVNVWDVTREFANETLFGLQVTVNNTVYRKCNLTILSNDFTGPTILFCRNNICTFNFVNSVKETRPSIEEKNGNITFRARELISYAKPAMKVRIEFLNGSVVSIATNPEVIEIA